MYYPPADLIITHPSACVPLIHGYALATYVEIDGVYGIANRRRVVRYSVVANKREVKPHGADD